VHLFKYDYATLSSTNSDIEILRSTTTLAAIDKHQFPIPGFQLHSTSYLELKSPATKYSATVTTSKAHMKTKLFSAAYDTI